MADGCPAGRRPLADGPIGAGEIHHFLLPATAGARSPTPRRPRSSRPRRPSAQGVAQGDPQDPSRAKTTRPAGRPRRAGRAPVAGRHWSACAWPSAASAGPSTCGERARRPIAGSESREAIEKALRDPDVRPRPPAPGDGRLVRPLVLAARRPGGVPRPADAGRVAGHHGGPVGGRARSRRPASSASSQTSTTWLMRRAPAHPQLPDAPGGRGAAPTTRG